MAFKLTNCKEVALKAFIHEWMKEPTLYCNHCGNIYVKSPEGCIEEPCCERMQIGTNLTLLHALIHENKRIRETRANQFASNKDKTFRMAVSITPRLLHDLEEYSINTLKEPLWKDDAELNSFMRSFPMFNTCEVI
jgi:hypothetical protein